MFAPMKTVDSIDALITSWERAEARLDENAMQTLLLGLNKLFNADLVFELVAALSPESDSLTSNGQQRNRRDFDALIDRIKSALLNAHARLVEHGHPVELDAWVLEDLIDGWSETVWKHTDALLRSRTPFETDAVRFQIERRTTRRAEAIRTAAEHAHHIA